MDLQHVQADEIWVKGVEEAAEVIDLRSDSVTVPTPEMRELSLA